MIGEGEKNRHKRDVRRLCADIAVVAALVICSRGMFRSEDASSSIATRWVSQGG